MPSDTFYHAWKRGPEGHPIRANRKERELALREHYFDLYTKHFFGEPAPPLLTFVGDNLEFRLPVN